MILCGGLGTRLSEETEFKPKPMVEIGGKMRETHKNMGVPMFFLKTLDAMQLSVMKAISQAELKAVVCADEKFCKVITLEGFSVTNPLKNVPL